MRKFIQKYPIIEFLAVVIITIPAFLSLLNNQYFSMHDDQQVARLFLLDKGIHQGYLFPRWVDTLGFGYGYPLFNFYPPLVYYVGEIFHLFGASFIWSIKLVFISGFVLAAVGMYLAVRQLLGKLPALLASVLYTYFLYHAINVYVRGAMAEFFSMTVVPFVFWAVIRLGKNLSVRNSVFFGIAFAFLLLCHPLISFPTVFYLGFFFLFYLFTVKEKIKFTAFYAGGGILGLLLSAFFWLPSLVEKKYTFVDDILTKELASYKIHFVCPQQLLNSPWGYGGSGPGCFDGMTYQLGKIHLALIVFSFLTFIYFVIKNRKDKSLIQHYVLAFLLLVFSIFMTVPFSSFIWDNIKFLWYLQFPWRFFTFIAFFVSVIGAWGIYNLEAIGQLKKYLYIVQGGLVLMISLGCIVVYGKYFKPQTYRNITDADLTSFEDIAWRISKTSFEFVPKGIITTKTQYDTTTLDINHDQLPTSSYKILEGNVSVNVLQNKMANKEYSVDVIQPSIFRLNTYNFPGWKATLDSKPLTITDNNSYKLITTELPEGKHTLSFTFTDTPLRLISNWVSILSVLVAASLLWFFRKTAKKQES
jgi:hypothetical protein